MQQTTLELDDCREVGLFISNQTKLLWEDYKGRREIYLQKRKGELNGIKRRGKNETGAI